MANLLYQRSLWAGGLLLLAVMLGGCGLTQSVTDGTAAVTQAVFYKQIKTLHLDFSPRAALNADGDKAPLSTMVRIYQLKDRQAFDNADYQQLLRQADNVLQADRLTEREVLVVPGGTASLDMPMEKDAKFVAVVGLFRAPSMEQGNWRLVLPRDDLEPDAPRVIELGNGTLTLLPSEV